MVIIETEQGTLRGIVCHYSDITYFAFKGIPYAKPPLGELRFKAPYPPEPWKGIRDASQHASICPQYNERMQRLDVGSEDCLYLNVYSKNIDPSEPLPVMVWIHGGAFYTGSGNSDYYGPEFFMRHDMILVTINYRLEALGFLCLDNEEVPGNAGLKDQVAALRWVKKNIVFFGGDSDNITLFGCSAGSASTSYHLLSKMSEYLFNKAVCQSGVCLNEWAYGVYARKRAFQLGKLLGIDTEDSTELIQFLRTVPVSSLVNIKLPSLENEHKDITDGILFSPVIEKSDLNVEKFITEPPPILVKRGEFSKVPLILGYTSGEGIEIGRNFSHLLGFLSNVGAVVPRELKFTLNKSDLLEVDHKIRDYYFKDKHLDIDMLQEFVNMETDRLFAYNIFRFARYYNYFAGMPVYIYKFMAESERNYTKKNYKMDSIEGVCHADDLPYFFNVKCLDIPLTDESNRIIQQIIQLWFNFASTGNPTSSLISIKWHQFTDTKRYCLLIDKELKCVPNVDSNNIQFWEDIYKERSLS